MLASIAVVTGICLICGPYSEAAEQSAFDEHQIKSAFIYNLTYFIFWNKQDLGRPSDPFRILVLENNELHENLKKTVQGESVQNHPIHVDPFPLHPLGAYRIIFIPNDKTFRTQQILEKIQGQQTLLMGESIDFLKKGGMIALIRHKNQIKIHFNRDAIVKANIHVSSKLYRIGIPLNSQNEHTLW